jgi:hypothetical protein
MPRSFLAGFAILMMLSIQAVADVGEFRIHLQGLKVLVDISEPDGTTRTYVTGEEVEEKDQEGRPGTVTYSFWEAPGKRAYLIVRRWRGADGKNNQNIIQAFDSERHRLYVYGPTDLEPLYRSGELRCVALGHVKGTQQYPMLDRLVFLDGKGLTQKEVRNPNIGFHVSLSPGGDWALFRIEKALYLCRFSRHWERRMSLEKVLKSFPGKTDADSLVLSDWGNIGKASNSRSYTHIYSGGSRTPN